MMIPEPLWAPVPVLISLHSEYLLCVTVFRSRGSKPGYRYRHFHDAKYVIETHASFSNGCKRIYLGLSTQGRLALSL